ncbi:FAD-binding oxidoreductase [Actinophytocola sp.]|uniref:FAD-binding oxidoreductase n=1 Tax=Actinophytocola sp. TaxID=1872138 RepID=UPI0025BD1999|nr:FAD-binding oxidoreductase [Actinophytocola sp.]
MRTERIRSWWGWGWQDAAVGEAERKGLVGRLPPHWVADPMPVPRVDDLDLRPPRVRTPDSLAPICTAHPHVRVAHTYGKAYRDVIRALRGEFARAPDLVAFPETEEQIGRLLDWAGDTGTAVIPYGGGSSVVGGVEYRGDGHDAVLSLDLTRLDRVLEVDRTSRAALIQAGALGPVLESRLAPHGLTLRHFPQSFEFSTLGGWLATRAGGHFAMRHTHIDDFVEALRVISPSGLTQTRRLPSSGAGPSPDRLFLGSEGTLGVITEAWLRLQDRPVHKASRGISFGDFAAGLDAVRAIAQSGLDPSNCRLLDEAEAAINTGRADGRAVLVLGFESADHPVDPALARAVEIAEAHGGTADPKSTQDSVGGWRSAFLRMPYVRDALARSGAIVETFETACTWRTAAELCATVRTGVQAAITEVCGEPGIVTARVTHVYPDGVAPYFTVIARSRRGSEVQMWDQIKAAASDILDRLEASVTHHHAVGRDHRRWYDAQRPHEYCKVLRAAKSSLDPHGILNPGVLFD